MQLFRNFPFVYQRFNTSDSSDPSMNRLQLSLAAFVQALLRSCCSPPHTYEAAPAVIPKATDRTTFAQLFGHEGIFKAYLAVAVHSCSKFHKCPTVGRLFRCIERNTFNSSRYKMTTRCLHITPSLVLYKQKHVPITNVNINSKL